MDFPQSHIEKSGIYSGSTTLQIAYSAAGAIGTMLKLFTICLSFYIAYSTGILVGFIFFIATISTDRLFNEFVRIASLPSVVGYAVYANLVFLILGPVIVWHFGTKLLMDVGLI